MVVIEINPRTSRSSALASKATGFPIAFVSALLAGGMTMDEIPYWRLGTLDKYEPWGDYVVVKFARWAFEKFPALTDKLGTQMLAVGEVMSIGKNYKEAFQKAIRSLEIGRYGLGFAKDFHKRSLEDLLQMLAEPTSERQFIMYEALRKGASVETLCERTFIKRWFIEQMKELVELEEEILKHRGGTAPGPTARPGQAGRVCRPLPGEIAGRVGAGDSRASQVAGGRGRVARGAGQRRGECRVLLLELQRARCDHVSDRPKIMVLGGGPNRIGQGIEFDYCCVHAAFAIRDAGLESIMVNCNPETVSTDYDTSDKLYFEPLTVEDVLSIYEKEKPEGVIVQFGGQTPLNLARELAEAGVKILGTSPDSIELAEDRDRFRQMMRRLGIPQPDSGMASTFDEALSVAREIGYPLMVRPSFVLGGRAMEVIHDEEELHRYLDAAVEVSPDRPVLIDKFLENAIEVEADAIADGEDAFVPAVMEHIELAGVHSGDSACVIPPISIAPKHIDTIHQYNRKIAIEFNVIGLMNIQYAIYQDSVYVLEANPRASRTVPLVSKVCNIPMARIATQVILGKKLSELGLGRKSIPHFGVKEAVFPFTMYHEVDPLLGPEMRSTGEVLGLAESFGLAFYRAQQAAQSRLPADGTVLISVADPDKPAVVEVARRFDELGFTIKATAGTHSFLAAAGIKAEPILKMHEGRPNIADAIANGEIQLVINTPSGKRSKQDDSYIRKSAVKQKVPYMTTLAAGLAAAKGIAAFRKGHGQVHSLQEYHAGIR